MLMNNDGCNSCTSLAGLVLSFIACFIVLVIALLRRIDDAFSQIHTADGDADATQLLSCVAMDVTRVEPGGSSPPPQTTS